jgi:hypothetical protein
VKIRGAATAIATFVVAMIVALAVPVSQLRTFSVETSCCCPDPSHCHCPHDKPDHSTQPSARPCHRTSHEIVSPVAPAFVRVAVAIVDQPPAATEIATEFATTLLDAPDPTRPDAPS